MPNVHAFIDDTHKESLRRLSDERYFRHAQNEVEEATLQIHARSAEMLFGVKVARPLKISLGLILFLTHEDEKLPLFWAGDDVRGDTHRSLIPEIMLKLPHEYLRASVWATRQMRLDGGNALVEVLPAKSHEYVTDYGGELISKELGLISLKSLSMDFENTPFVLRTAAYENGVENSFSHGDEA